MLGQACFGRDSLTRFMESEPTEGCFRTGASCICRTNKTGDIGPCATHLATTPCESRQLQQNLSELMQQVRLRMCLYMVILCYTPIYSTYKWEHMGAQRIGDFLFLAESSALRLGSWQTFRGSAATWYQISGLSWTDEDQAGCPSAKSSNFGVSTP
jgi:hypothetical protein